MWTAPREAMHLLGSRAIEKFGSLQEWPLAIGVSPDAIEKLRRGLLE
jgi:hypothetical protein